MTRGSPENLQEERDVLVLMCVCVWVCQELHTHHNKRRVPEKHRESHSEERHSWLQQIRLKHTKQHETHWDWCTFTHVPTHTQTHTHTHGCCMQRNFRHLLVVCKAGDGSDAPEELTLSVTLSDLLLQSLVVFHDSPALINTSHPPPWALSTVSHTHTHTHAHTHSDRWLHRCGCVCVVYLESDRESKQTDRQMWAERSLCFCAPAAHMHWFCWLRWWSGWVECG